MQISATTIELALHGIARIPLNTLADDFEQISAAIVVAVRELKTLQSGMKPVLQTVEGGQAPAQPVAKTE